MQLATIDYGSPSWENLTDHLRSEVVKWLTALAQPPITGITVWLKKVAQNLGVSYPTARRKFDTLRKSNKWESLIDRRQAPQAAVHIDGTGSLIFRAELVKIAENYQRNHAAAIRALHKRWKAREVAIPGYETWPGWPHIPAGWNKRNLMRIIKLESNISRFQSIRVGTSSKTNPYLPTVHLTRVGLWPGAVTQFDDQWHDNFVTLGTKREIARVIELGALDLFSGHRFHWGAKPRRTGADGKAENIRKRDMHLFAAGNLHRHGYSSRGSMWMVEHGTAAISERIEKLLYDATHGLIRIERQPIEGKQAALNGYWSGTEGGNFRAKACLESTHNLIRNDMAAIPLQSGSYSSGLKGPVTTERQLHYLRKILADVMQRCPHRAHLLRLPTWDFHTQLIPWLTDYYEFGLGARTDHSLEGWATLGHVVTEYRTTPQSTDWLSESQFLSLPEESQLIIGNAARSAPAQWSQRRNLSPAEVWNRRTDFNPIPPAVIAEILSETCAKELTVRNGFVEFYDLELAPDQLIYKARFISGLRKNQEIFSGEKVLLVVNPFDDSTAFVCDAAGRLQGELPLYKRVLSIDPEAFHTEAIFENRPSILSHSLEVAAGEKHARIAEILEPTRINQAERVTEARDLRKHNQEILRNITPKDSKNPETTAASVLSKRVNLVTESPY